MRERFDFLSRYVNAATSEDLLMKVLNNVERTRYNIMRFHRTAVLCPMLTAQCGYGEWVPDREVLPSFILKPVEVTSPTVSPQLLQNAAHLFSFIYADLDRLLEGLMVYKGTPTFNYAIHSAIPALFGFFCSHEHCVFALAFYIRVVNYIDCKVGFEVLLPFLSCPGMFLYIESCLNPFFDRLMRDTRFHDKMSSKEARELEVIYAKDLVSLFAKYMHLIPKCIRVVIDLMNQQWGVAKAGKLIVGRLLQFLSLTFVHATGRVKHETFLKSIFKYIDRRMQNAIMELISKEQPRSIIPELFSIFGHDYLSFFACVSDIELLGFLMAAKRKLPPSLACILVNPKHATKLPLKQSTFWFKVYPKRKSTHEDPRRPLFFEVARTKSVHGNPEYQRTWNKICSLYEFPMKFVDENPAFQDDFREFCLEESVAQLNEAAGKMEDVLWYRLWLDTIERWQETSEEHARIMTMPIADLACTQAKNRGYSSIAIAHRNSCLLFDSRLIKQDQFMILVELSLSEIIGDKKPVVDNLRTLWTRFIRSKAREMDSVTSVTGRQTGDAIFWEAVEGLSTLDTEPFRNCYRILIRSMRRVFCLINGKKDEIVQQAIILSQCNNLVSIYIAIKKYVMTVKQFTDLCTEEEEILWVLLERALLNLILASEDVRDAFFELEGGQ